MIPSQVKIISKIKKRKELRRRIFTVILIMSFLVSGEVVWNLRSIALTLANDAECGTEEHIHSEECYEKKLICDRENEDNGEKHIHTQSCYEDVLVCTKKEHTHTIECYSDDEVTDKADTGVTELESVTVYDEAVGENSSEKTVYTSDVQEETDGEDQISLLSNDLEPGAFYIDSGKGITKINSNSQSGRYQMLIGASVKIYYNDANNTNGWFYEVSGVAEVKDNSLIPDNSMRIVSAKVTAIKAGDTAVYINGIPFYLTVYARTADVLYTCVGPREQTCEGNSSSNRYNILRNDSFKLIVYDSQNSNGYFYDPDNSGAVIIDNSQSTVDGKRIVTAVITASGTGNVTLAFRTKRLYLNIIDRQPGLIYLANGDQESLPDGNSQSDPVNFSPGDTFKLSIYEDSNQISQNFFYEASASKLISVSNNTVLNSVQIRKITVTITVNNSGETTVGFKNQRFYLRSDKYELEKLFLVDSAGNETPAYNNYDSPYIIGKDETFTLCYYEDGQDALRAKEWFYCSFDKNPDEPIILSYKNSDSNVTDSVRRATARFTALKAGRCTVLFKDKCFYVDIRLNYARKNIIYVNTALGEREKDKVHEYIDLIGGDPSANDGKYIFNTNANPYLIYTGDSIELSAYLDPGYSNNYFYTDADDPTMTSSQKSNTFDNESGLRKTTAKYTGIKSGKCEIKVDTGNGILSFFVMVRDLSKFDSWQECDHADIEVSDGGCYEITKTVIYADGTSITTETSYDSYIVAVNQCELFTSEGVLVNRFIASDYQLNGNPGESQYELTSKYSQRADRKYNPGIVNYAKFNVKMLLKPSTITVIKKVNGETTEVTVTDSSDDTTSEDLTLPNVEFILDNRSKIDALNKCPDHSGFDFSVSAALNDVINVSPVMAQIKAEKKLTGKDLIDRQFGFSLIDQDGNTVNTAYNDSDGKITFDHYFLTPGTYNFTVRENIPDTPENYKYDTSVKQVTVTVTEKIADGQSKLVPEVRYNTDMVFNNTVSACTDLKVTKSWSDGNQNHSGDKILFVIYRRKNGGSEEIISVGGISKFELSSSSGWSKTFAGLPVQEGETRYTYRIEEDHFEGYTPDYQPGVIDADNISGSTSARIVNSLKEPTSVSIRKQWTDSRGDPLTGEPPVTSVTAVLKRDFKKIKIPVLIEIYSSAYPQKLIKQFKEYAYTGSGFSFKIYNDMNKVRVSSVKISDTRNGEYSNNIITVKNIEYGDVVRVYCDREYDQVSDGIFYLRQSFTGSKEGWTTRSALLGDAYTTSYTNSGNGRSQALKIYNRTAQWHGAALDVKNILVPGQKYSVSAYAQWNNVFTDSGGATASLENHSTELIITLQYTSQTDNTLKYLSVASKSVSANVWTLLQNIQFEVPGDVSDPYLVIETSENISGKYSDLYLDEVTIAPEETIVSVSGAGTVYIGNAGDYQYSKSGETIPDDVRYSAENWVLDTMDSWKEFRLRASENWIRTFSAEELGEKGDRIYRYYTAEKNKVDGYDTIAPTERVSSNSPSDPLIIENRQIQYELPATGGSGAEKYLIAGSATMLLSVISFLCIMIAGKKRRDSS